MSDKLVTLAIRTYKRANRIKDILEESGIKTVIHNLNIENPEVAVGVRVRIDESDLPRALAIVEEMEKAWDSEDGKGNGGKKRTVLMPIQLTDNIKQICLYGFNYAKRMNADVVFLYAYFTPVYSISSANEITTYSLTDSEVLRRIMSGNRADVENLRNLVESWIVQGVLPKVKFDFVLKEGVPEDKIADYCKREKPNLVVMQTNVQRSGASENLIGSVTSEVLETSVVPVLAVPHNEKEYTPVRKIAFLTNFDQKDLIAIDQVLSYFDYDGLEVFFIHASQEKDKWNEVMLAGIKEYFAKHYEGVNAKYVLIPAKGKMEKLDEFLKNEKIELVALNTKKRNLFARFFNQGMATKLLFNLDTMLLVTHI